MKPISSETKILYDALLVKGGVPLKESLSHFIKKIEEQEPERATTEAGVSRGIHFLWDKEH